MPLFEIATGLKIAGSIFGGRSRKKRARKQFRRAVLRIREDAQTAKENLQRQEEQYFAALEASVGATGMRSTSGMVQAIRQSEAEKGILRREAILQQEERAIQDAAEQKKSVTSAANFNMFSSIVDAGLGYFSNMPASSSASASVSPSPSYARNLPTQQGPQMHMSTPMPNRYY